MNSILRELERDLRQWKERLAQPQFFDYRLFFECMRRGRNAPQFEEAIELLDKGLMELISKIVGIRAEAIRDLPVSAIRLEEVGKWASELAFSKESGHFPLPLFATVGESDVEFQEKRLILKNAPKGQHTEPAMAQRAANEKEWFGNLLRDYVGIEVLAETIQLLAPIEEEAKTPDVYWKKMKRYAADARSASRNPILLIENRTIPQWIYEWTHPYGRLPDGIPLDLDVWRDPAFTTESYMGNLNDIAVFVARIAPGASCLLTAESLRSVKFTRLPSGSNVRVEALPHDENPSIIDLKFTWWVDLDVDLFPAVNLAYKGYGVRRRSETVT